MSWFGNQNQATHESIERLKHEFRQGLPASAAPLILNACAVQLAAKLQTDPSWAAGHDDRTLKVAIRVQLLQMLPFAALGNVHDNVDKFVRGMTPEQAAQIALRASVAMASVYEEMCLPLLDHATEQIAGKVKLKKGWF